MFGGKRFPENRIQRFHQSFPRSLPVRRRVLESIRNPDVGDARGPQRGTHGRADRPGPAAMFDPECAYRGIRMRQGETIVHQRMSETGRVVIESKASFASPFNPTLEMFRLDLIAVHRPATELSIHGVKIDPVTAWNQGERLFEVGAEFSHCPGPTRVVPGDGETGAEFAGSVLKPRHVVPLPAVHRNTNPAEHAQCRIHIHTDRGIVIAGRPLGRRVPGGRTTAVFWRSVGTAGTGAGHGGIADRRTFPGNPKESFPICESMFGDEFGRFPRAGCRG